MSEIFVMYELDQPPTARSVPDGAPGEGRTVRRVHAAHAAPGTSTTPGPRTLCGKDTFAMDPAERKPSEPARTSWYPPAYAGLVCAQCDAVMEA
ncbi:hypothetical protein AB0K02_23290 [Streptomyces sp. NPDC049597]|uniref:hypothetical protein n=1 Tax=Streptomyces sp. NPDC049597 TaxID=3155276 RepID=UPI0034208C50